MEPRSWNGTWPDGSVIEPAVGILVARHNGEWVVVFGVGDKGDRACIGGIETGDHITRACTPIAPPPGVCSLWDALRNLGDRIDDYGRIIKLQRSDIVVIEDRPIFWRPWSRIDTDIEAAELIQDGNNFRTLLAYAAQWEAK